MGYWLEAEMCIDCNVHVQTICKSSSQMERATQYVLRQDLDAYPGGVPTSLVKSGQQWDFPNCWPPIEHIMVQGLEATGLPDARHTSHPTPFKIKWVMI